MNIEIEDLRRVVEAPSSWAARSCSAATRSAARSPPRTRPGTSTASRAPTDLVGPRVHRRRQQPDAAITRRGDPARCRTSQTGSPWLAFGGIPAPFAGPVQRDAARRASKIDPERAVARPVRAGCCRANLKPPVPRDERRPVRLRARRRRPRRRASPPPRRTSGSSRRAATRAAGTRTGAITPIQRYADMFSGRGCRGSTAPRGTTRMRLTIDAGAVGSGQRQPGPEHPRRAHDARPRPAEAACGSTPSAPRWAGSACSTAPRCSPTSRASRRTSSR